MSAFLVLYKHEMHIKKRGMHVIRRQVLCVSECGDGACEMCDYCGRLGNEVCDGVNCRRVGVTKSALCKDCEEKHGRCRYCQVVMRECEQTFRHKKEKVEECACGFCGKGKIGKDLRKGACLVCGIAHCGERCKRKDSKRHESACLSDST